MDVNTLACRLLIGLITEPIKPLSYLLVGEIPKGLL